jgi:phospholipid/cholesterol/gamma-HCH transport system substrate-binding protein
MSGVGAFYGRHRRRILGLLGLGLVLTVVALAALTYAQVFTPVVTVEVVGDRSGLLLDPQADVTSRGVNVGEVRAVEPDNGRARIRIAVYPQYAEQIPSNSLAAIDAPTVFGAKFVQLNAPVGPSEGPLRDGDVIQAPEVTTEANDVFQNLMSLLTSIDPSQLNATLGAISTALQGRGDELGRFLAQLNDFLVRFNPQLPLLQRDLRSGADVANVYADAAPNILRIADNATVLSRTLQDKQAGLDALFLSFTKLGGDATTLLQQAGPPLDAATANLRPTTGLLAQYSPIFPCLFGEVNELRQSLEQVIGNEFPGVSIYTSILPSQTGYKNPADKPLVGVRNPPSCNGGPLVAGQKSVGPTKIPYVPLNDGLTTVDYTRSVGSISSPEQLASTLFGPDIVPLLDLRGVGPAPGTRTDNGANSTATPGGR